MAYKDGYAGGYAGLDSTATGRFFAMGRIIHYGLVWLLRR